MLLPKAKFIQYQGIFYSKVSQSPYEVTIQQNAVAPGATALESFTGDSKRRIVKTVKLRCLYEKIVNKTQREKYGIPETIDGVIFVSPRQLIAAFGSYTISKNLLTMEFESREQLVNNITYMESLYDSCVSVRFDIRDKLKGG